MKLYKTQTLIAACAAALFIAPSSRAEDAPSRIHELVNLDFLSEYVTPRGMIVHEQSDQGMAFQPLLLTLVNLYHSDGFISSFDFDGGAWADFSSRGVSVHPPYGAKPTTDFVEIDPIAGLSVEMAKKFKLALNYTAFGMQILDIGYSQHLETKLSFDDSSYMGAWALHPYVSLWDELAKKATDADLPDTLFKEGFYPVAPRKGASAPQPNSSFYFDIGVDPSYTFKDGIKLEAPCRMLLPDERFYGDYYAPSSTVGLWELGAKATFPMNFMPAGYGHWSFHLGVNFLYFVDDNLVNLNVFNAPGKPTRDNVQGYAGVSVFF